MQGALMADPISTIFGFCVWVLQVIGDFHRDGLRISQHHHFRCSASGSDPRPLSAVETCSGAKLWIAFAQCRYDLRQSKTRSRS